MGYPTRLLQLKVCVLRASRLDRVSSVVLPTTVYGKRVSTVKLKKGEFVQYVQDHQKDVCGGIYVVGRLIGATFHFSQYYLC